MSKYTIHVPSEIMWGKLERIERGDGYKYTRYYAHSIDIVRATVSLIMGYSALALIHFVLFAVPYTLFIVAAATLIFILLSYSYHEYEYPSWDDGFLED